MNGKVIMYADTITESMQRTIDETMRRRMKQMRYNEEHHITPQPIMKAIRDTLPAQGGGRGETSMQKAKPVRYIEPNQVGAFAADPIVQRMTRPQLEKSIADTTLLMKEAAKNLDFLQAAQYRDEIIRMQKELELK